MEVFKPSKYEGKQLDPKLEELLKEIFAVMPNLEYTACGARGAHLDDESAINDVEVFDGDQKLGKVGHVQQYTRNNGYEYTYRIYSRKITRVRGDSFTKRTKSPKSALRIAKEVFVRDNAQMQITKIAKHFSAGYNNLVWHVSSTYKDLRSQHYEKAFAYLLSVVDGEPIPIDTQVLQAIQSDNFKQARDNYRIAKSVQKTLEKNTGAIVYVDRNNKITMADLETTTLTKIDSTYDLPKNYQEKYTMLKIMEFNQPIENVGVKMRVEVDDQSLECYYLKPGDTIVTH